MRFQPQKCSLYLESLIHYEIQVSQRSLESPEINPDGNFELVHVQDTADIEQGDLLVSSGLGQKFPVGYPVGVVTEVTHDPGEPFAVVKARSSAHLDRSRHLLLVFTAEQMKARSTPVKEADDGS